MGGRERGAPSRAAPRRRAAARSATGRAACHHRRRAAAPVPGTRGVMNGGIEPADVEVRVLINQMLGIAQRVGLREEIRRGRCALRVVILERAIFVAFGDARSSDHLRAPVSDAAATGSDAFAFY